MTSTETPMAPAVNGGQNDSDWETSSEPADEVVIKYNSLRNKRAFPNFTKLPFDDDVDARYYRTRDGGYSYNPRKHWCFLGEISSVSPDPRLFLLVTDSEGVRLPVTFYTDRQGREIPPATLRVGHTVAILYPDLHGQGDITTGIRVDDMSFFKIIPTSLNKLYQLSDNVLRYSPEVDGKRRCHGCDEEKETLNKCGVCAQFWYCNKTCQTAGWKNKGHKHECKLIKDRDLRTMIFRVDWSRFTHYLEFPLSAWERED